MESFVERVDHINIVEQDIERTISFLKSKGSSR